MPTKASGWRVYSSMSRLWTIAMAATLVLTGCTSKSPDPAPTKPSGKVVLDPKAARKAWPPTSIT